jgi:hypothetical protein
MVTSPLPRTPGDQREDHAQAVADAVAAIYEPLELALIGMTATLSRQVASGVLLPAVAQRKLLQGADALFSAAAPKIRAVLSAGFTGARPTMSVPAPVGDWMPLARILDHANDEATTSLAQGLKTAVSAAEHTTSSAPPAPGNIFAQVSSRAVAEHRNGLPGTSLSLSRIQAAQSALDEFGTRGITGFTDRAGRRWDLTSYVEMATRTAVSRAWDDVQAGALMRSGLDLVEVYTHSAEGSCPQCLPWLGRTLSLTGATRGYATLAEARAAGFRHPSCRCSWTALGAGVAAEATNPVALDRAAAIYKASQKQRALERRVRAAGRQAHAAITPASRAAARRELAAAKAASQTHRRLHHLAMTKVAVQRREHPFAAR